MAEKFHERFHIPVSLDSAKASFVRRVGNEIFRSGPWMESHYRVYQAIATELGQLFNSRAAPEEYTAYDFLWTLRAIEGIYLHYFIDTNSKHLLEFERTVNKLLQMSEVDLGVRWRDGKFYRAGAEELDTELVNKSLDWLKKQGYQTVRGPFEKALSHLLHAVAHPERLSDVITDAKEALEALAKKVTGKEGTLEKLAELFLSKVHASNEYKVILRDYCDYANKFRHGAAEPAQKPKLSYAETESFVYLTGLFIRLVISAGFASETV